MNHNLAIGFLTGRAAFLERQARELGDMQATRENRLLHVERAEQARTDAAQLRETVRFLEETAKAEGRG